MRLAVSVGACVIALGVATTPVAGRRDAPQQVPAGSPAAPTLVAAFQAAYNLDHDESVAIARRAVAMAPDEPAAHRALAAMLWLQILYRRGTVTVDHYLGGVSKSDIDFPKPAPDVDAEFKRELGRAIELAEARFTRAPQDVQARFDVGAAYALQASYAASVEGKVGAAFMSAKRAFDAQEDVMARDPARTDAGLVVGVYRYLVGSFGWPTRMLAYMAGFGGDKAKGIRMLEVAASHPATRVDARTALILILSREGRHAEVERLARELQQEAPRNRLLILEEGAAAIRAGHGREAEAALTRGLAVFARDNRPKVPGERALWLYKRGLARVNLNHPADASVDLLEALGASPQGWVRGRIHLELGKVADLASRRPDALQHYQTARSTCEASRDPQCASEAGRLIRRPFTFGGGRLPMEN